MIEQIKSLKIIDFDKKSKSELERIYKGGFDNNKTGLIDDAETLYTLFESDKDKTNKHCLQNSINKYKDAIDVFTNVITVFHNKFTDEKNKEQKENLRGYVENLQIHLTRLQYQCNQLVYQKQQCNNKSSMCIARIALLTTIIFSTLSILCSYFDWKCKKSDLPIQIECLSDSIIILNRKIEQQNEIIQNFISNDSVINQSN
jgi:hypothetical protein